MEFLRRESRVIPSLINFWQHFKWWGARTDPRSKAALSSILWRFLSPGAAAAAGGGLLLAIQTYLISLQNEKLDQHTYVMQAQANRAVNAQIGPVLQQIGDWMNETACIGEKTRCWVDIEAPFRDRWIEACAATPACSERVWPRASQDRSLPLLQLPLNLRSQIAALTYSARPYRSIHTNASGKPVLTERDESPERGSVLLNLVSMGVEIPENADFRSAYVADANLSYATISMDFYSRDLIFRRTSFLSATLNGQFLYSDFRCSEFGMANLTNASFIGGDLSRVSFWGAKLPKADAFKDTSLEDANLAESVVEESDFLERLGALSVRNFDRKEWKIETESNGKYKILPATSDKKVGKASDC